MVTLTAPLAHAQSQPVVEPIPDHATTPTATAVPAPTARQANDDESPHAHGEAAIFNRNIAVQAEPETSQLAAGLAIGVGAILGAIVAVSSTSSGSRQLWYAGAALLGGTIGTGAIVCALGQKSATRHGGCTTSIAGAVIGSVVGIAPGLLLTKWMASQPCTATGPNADDQCAVGGFAGALVGLTVAGGGYLLGTAYGARMGWELGATPRAIGSAPAANVSLLSLQF
jgi:hypothetical protein